MNQAYNLKSNPKDKAMFSVTIDADPQIQSDAEYPADETNVSYLSPPVDARKAKPYQDQDLEKHPDCDRIWATVMALRASWARDFMDAAGQ